MARRRLVNRVWIVLGNAVNAGISVGSVVRGGRVGQDDRHWMLAMYEWRRYLYVTITEADRQNLKAIAARQRLSLSAFVRVCLNDYLQRHQELELTMRESAWRT